MDTRLRHILVWNSFTVSGGGYALAQASGNAFIGFSPNLIITFTSTPSFNVLFIAQYGGVINLFNASFSGSIASGASKYEVIGGGILYTGAGNSSGLACASIPGSAGVTQGSGGQCIGSDYGLPCPPVTTTYSSGSGTYTTPSCNGVLATYLWVRLGGGGGGGGGGTGASSGGRGGGGGNTTFSDPSYSSVVSITAYGGNGGYGGSGYGEGASGGSATGADVLEMVGGSGSSGTITPNSSVYPNGGVGGGSPIATGGQPGMDSAGGAGTGCGGGGGGGSTGSPTSGYYGGGGGGAGGYAESIASALQYQSTSQGPYLSSSYSYSVGSGGSAGAGGGYAGGSGAGGCIIIVAQWSSSFGR